MDGVGFALDFEGVELALFGFKGAQGGSFFIFVTGGDFGFAFLGSEGVDSEGCLGAAEFCGRASHFAIKGAPSGIDHQSCLRKWTSPILNKAILAKVFEHVFEKVFLIPSGEHRCRKSGKVEG